MTAPYFFVKGDLNLTLDDIRNIYENWAVKPIGKHKFFSVLVPFVEKDGSVHLLFEVRAKNMESQPGEVCFPGGHVEKGENPRDTAVRETFEEIGIPPDKIELISQGDTLYGYANYTLFTYMGIIPYEAYQEAKLASEEVDEIFLVPLSKFIENPPEVHSENIFTDIDENFPYDKVGIGKDYQWRVGDWQIPIYDIDGKIIWGLTARITENLIEVLQGKNPFQ